MSMSISPPLPSSWSSSSELSVLADFSGLSSKSKHKQHADIAAEQTQAKAAQIHEASKSTVIHASPAASIAYTLPFNFFNLKNKNMKAIKYFVIGNDVKIDLSKDYAKQGLGNKKSSCNLPVLVAKMLHEK